MIEAGMAMAAIALILGALMAFLSGAAVSMGESIRAAVAPPLRAIRDNSPKSRADLADDTVVLAVTLAAGSTIVDRSFFSALIAVVLWKARPAIARVTREEQPMLALAGQFSSDLIIGVYAPVVLAQLLLGNVLLSASLATVLIALCWPPGGPGHVADGWRPAWVTK